MISSLYFLLGIGAVVSVLVLLVRLVPSFAAKAFYWRCKIQAYLFYACNTTKRKLYGKMNLDVAPYGGSTHISASWMQKTLEKNFKTKLPALQSVEILKDTIAGGLTGKIYRIKLHWTQSPPEALDIPSQMIVKTVQNQPIRLFSSLMLGTPREAIFSKLYGQDNRDPALDVMPRVFYADGSYRSGEYVTVMEDLSLLSAFHGGIMLGNQCWGEVPVPDHIKQDPLFVVETVFSLAADIHATFWRDESLLKSDWLKNVAWLQGRNRASWEMAMINMRHMYNNVSKAIAAGKTKVPWTDKLRKNIERVLNNTSWETYHAKFNLSDPNTPFTLCHGDFHASNLLWCPKSDKLPEPKPFLVDWSEVGVFCPFTELAQFIVSHIPVEVRRANERRIFERYYHQLIEKGVDGKIFTLEACWQRYINGGIERWIQMLILLANISVHHPTHIPDSAIAWFYNQVSTFVEDHDPNGDLDVSLMSAYCLA